MALREPGRIVFLGGLAAALLVAQQVAGKATRDALFLLHHPPSDLPAVMMLASLVSVLAAFAVGRLLSVRTPRQTLPSLIGLNAALLLLQFPLSLEVPALAATLVYLQVAAMGGTLLSAYWSVVNERFDPWTAKRVVGRLAMGASLGGVAGGVIAWSMARAISVPAMLVVVAALNVAALVVLVLFAGDDSRARTPSSGAAKAVSSPLTLLRGSSHLQQLALLVASSAVVEALLDYTFKAQAAAAVPAGPPLMALFAAFQGGTALVALAVQLWLTRPALQALGLAGTVALRPLTAALFSVAGFVDPRLWSAALARGGYDALSSSLFRSGYELLYTPLPEAEKRGAKQVVDVASDKLGALLGGALAFLGVRTLATPERALFLGAGALALLVLGLTGRLHRGYVTALAASLRAGRVQLDPGDVVDSTTRLGLIEAERGGPDDDALVPREAETPVSSLAARIDDLRSGQPARIRRGLRAPEPIEVPLTAHLIPLLARDDVYPDVLRALRRLAPRVTGQLVDALLDRETPAGVRRRLPRALKFSATRRSVEGLLLGLDDASFEVRAQSALAMAALALRAPELRAPAPAVFAAVRRELERSPARGAAALAASPALFDHVFVLLALVLDREPLQLAAEALRGDDPGLRGTALEYLENVLPPELAAELRRALKPRG